MPKKSRKTEKAEKITDKHQEDGYSLTLGSGLVELHHYDPAAASFLRRTICCGDYEFTLSAALRTKVSLEEFAPVTASGPHTNDSDVAVVGRRLADVLWEELCVSTYGWNRDPNDACSVKYYRPSLPPPDDVDRFVAGYSFLPRPDMVAGDIWNCRREVSELYETACSAMGGENDATAGKKQEMAGKLEENFARMSGELATLAEKLGPSPGFLLAEYLFPGSSENIQVCTQYVSDGNWKSLICATETHVYSLDFGTS